MPFEVNWEIERRVIWVSGFGNFDMDDARAINAGIINYLDAGTAPVHVLVDLSKVEQVPHDFIQLKNNQSYMEHPKTGWLIMFGADRMLTFLATLVTQMMRSKIRFLRTEEEARAFLAEVEPELFETE